ncbi:MAG: hypothetical protein ACRD3D_01090 [Terriglobia bacterium]
MANNLVSGSPLYVDTSIAGGAGLPVQTDALKVLWYNPTAAGATFSVTRKSDGKVLLQGYATAANQSQFFDLNADQRGLLNLPPASSGDWNVTISSGALLMYY